MDSSDDFDRTLKVSPSESGVHQLVATPSPANPASRVGAPVGKSHLLVALGHAAVGTARRVRYLTAAEFVETLYRGPGRC
jgi:hypothetical protein